MSLRENYIVLRPATQGVGGTQNSGIYLVQYRITNKTLIEKRITPNQNGTRSLHAEIRAMQQCRTHPNITSIFDYDTQDYNITYGSIWMQHCELGSLDTLIIRYAQRGEYLPDEGFAWKVFWDIALAVCYLSTGHGVYDTRQRAIEGRPVDNPMRGWNAIMHRDLKPANIFMTWNEPLDPHGGFVYPTVKIGDFGCCIREIEVSGMQNADLLFTRRDLAFDPPESMYSEKGDVYSCGLVLHCLGLMQQTPCSPAEELERKPFGDGSASEELTPRVQSCLMREKDDRPLPQDLPMLVWEGYDAWCCSRHGDGQPLPYWALVG